MCTIDPDDDKLRKGIFGDSFTCLFSGVSRHSLTFEPLYVTYILYLPRVFIHLSNVAHTRADHTSQPIGPK